MDKPLVKLPREVAFAIENHLDMGLHELMECVINMHSHETTTSQLCTIRDHFKHDWTMLADVVVNGYEIEKTPEERAIQWLIKKRALHSCHSEHDIVMGIKSILEGGGTE